MYTRVCLSCSCSPRFNNNQSSINYPTNPQTSPSQPCFTATDRQWGRDLNRRPASSSQALSRHSLRRLYHKHFPACCWPVYGRVVSFSLFHSHNPHVYHHHCFSAGLKAVATTFHLHTGSQQWPPLQLRVLSSTYLPLARHANGFLRCRPVSSLHSILSLPPNHPKMPPTHRQETTRNVARPFQS